MAVSATATKLGINQAILSAQLLSAATATAETLTVNHNLGFTPNKVIPVLRSIVSSPSSEPVLTVSSWGPSTATVIMTAGLGAREVVADILVERVHSIVR